MLRANECPYCGGPYTLNAGGCVNRCDAATIHAALVDAAAEAGMTEEDELLFAGWNSYRRTFTRARCRCRVTDGRKGMGDMNARHTAATNLPRRTDGAANVLARGTHRVLKLLVRRREIPLIGDSHVVEAVPLALALRVDAEIRRAVAGNITGAENRHRLSVRHALNRRVEQTEILGRLAGSHNKRFPSSHYLPMDMDTITRDIRCQRCRTKHDVTYYGDLPLCVHCIRIARVFLGLPVCPVCGFAKLEHAFFCDTCLKLQT